MKKVKIDPFVFLTSLVVILFAMVMSVMNRKTAEPYLDNIMTSITFKLDWAFQFLTIGSFILLLWLVFSRYGKIKLGEKMVFPLSSRLNH
ncbi:BCCT family transporter [Sporosarcina sp. JAI121]|uniref:BCCT family transporter n=1 Tax=Sporosarcina sp. JAI121 TaxID=2723064 RepID=UPI0015C92BF2|nr:BCCT family transporter [Sporosarcina sp. JAI121]NYF25369.1 choline-glycine betaine transporter [Sporosarcina sp. JAI121]